MRLRHRRPQHRATSKRWPPLRHHAPAPHRGPSTVLTGAVESPASGSSFRGSALRQRPGPKAMQTPAMCESHPRDGRVPGELVAEQGTPSLPQSVRDERSQATPSRFTPGLPTSGGFPAINLIPISAQHGHNRSFSTRSRILPRGGYEWQVSGCEPGPLFGSTRPFRVIHDRPVSGRPARCGLGRRASIASRCMNSSSVGANRNLLWVEVGSARTLAWSSSAWVPCRNQA